MSEMRRDPARSTVDQLATEFYRWLPSAALFLFYVASGDTLYFTCAVALVLGTTVRAIHDT